MDEAVPVRRSIV